jgi:hypothetical protein
VFRVREREIESERERELVKKQEWAVTQDREVNVWG